MSGNVIGVVTEKLEPTQSAGTSGEIPENINFAINASVIRTFIQSENIPYTTASSAQLGRSAPDIGDLGKSFTELVQCWQ